MTEGQQAVGTQRHDSGTSGVPPGRQIGPMQIKAPPRKGRFWIGLLVGLVTASIGWFAVIRFATSANAGGVPPLGIAFPAPDLLMIPNGGHFVEITNQGKAEIVVAPSLLVSHENLWFRAPKIALDPGETRRVEFLREERGSSHVQWAKSGDIIRVEAHGFMTRFQPADSHIP